MAVLAGGYGPKGAYSLISRLAELAGLDRRTMLGAYNNLINRILVVDLPARPGQKRFFIGPGVLGYQGTPSFFLLGELFASGVWSRLQPSDRCVLVALSAIIPGQRAITDEEQADAFTEWVSETAGIHEAEEEDAGVRGPYSYAYRVGRTTASALAAATGMHRTSVYRSLARLSESTDLVEIQLHGQEYFVHLPPGWWQPWPSVGHSSSY